MPEISDETLNRPKAEATIAVNEDVQRGITFGHAWCENAPYVVIRGLWTEIKGSRDDDQFQQEPYRWLQWTSVFEDERDIDEQIGWVPECDRDDLVNGFIQGVMEFVAEAQRRDFDLFPATEDE